MLARACLTLTLLLAAELHSEMEVDEGSAAAPKTPGEMPSLLPLAGSRAVSHFGLVAGSMGSSASATAGAAGASQVRRAAD